MTSFSPRIYQPYVHAADAWVNSAFEIIAVVGVWVTWVAGVAVVLAVVVLVLSVRSR